MFDFWSLLQIKIKHSKVRSRLQLKGYFLFVVIRKKNIIDIFRVLSTFFRVKNLHLTCSWQRLYFSQIVFNTEASCRKTLNHFFSFSSILLIFISQLFFWLDKREVNFTNIWVLIIVCLISNWKFSFPLWLILK